MLLIVKCRKNGLLNTILSHHSLLSIIVRCVDFFNFLVFLYTLLNTMRSCKHTSDVLDFHRSVYIYIYICLQFIDPHLRRSVYQKKIGVTTYSRLLMFLVWLECSALFYRLSHFVLVDGEICPTCETLGLRSSQYTSQFLASAKSQS